MGANSSAIATALLLVSDPRAAALSSLSMSLFGIITLALTSVPPVVRAVQELVGLQIQVNLVLRIATHFCSHQGFHSIPIFDSPTILQAYISLSAFNCYNVSSDSLLFCLLQSTSCQHTSKPTKLSYIPFNQVETRSRFNNTADLSRFELE